MRILGNYLYQICTGSTIIKSKKEKRSNTVIKKGYYAIKH